MTIQLGSLIGLMALLAACAFERGPGETVREFHMDVDQGRIAEAIKLVDMPDADTEKKLTTAFKEAAVEAQQQGHLRSVEIVKEDVKGDVAHVEYILHEPDGTDEREKMELRKVNGHWKLRLLTGDK
jgi:hypothetical protein